MTSRAVVASAASMTLTGLAVLAVLGTANSSEVLGSGQAADIPRQVEPPRPTAAPSSPVTEPEPADRVNGPAVLSTTSYSPSAACALTDDRGGSGWCLHPGGAFAGVSGQPVELKVSLCRLPGSRPAGATFPSTAEARFSLHDGDATLWNHARQHPGEPGRHTRRVDPGMCLTWRTTWWNRADDGSDLPPGEYELELAVLAVRINPSADEASQRYRYTVRPT